MQTSTQEVGQELPQQSTPRIVVHVGYHRLSMTLIKTYCVIVIVIEERSFATPNKRVILLALFFRHAAYQGALIIV